MLFGVLACVTPACASEPWLPLSAAWCDVPAGVSIYAMGMRTYTSMKVQLTLVCEKNDGAPGRASQGAVLAGKWVAKS